METSVFLSTTKAVIRDPFNFLASLINGNFENQGVAAVGILLLLTS